MKKATATPDYQISVKCPHCKEDIDALKYDDENQLTEVMFRNYSMESFEFNIQCPSCEKEFIINKLEY